MSLITLDFETYYASDYSLTKMTTESYIRDPRFETIGLGARIEDETPIWVSGETEVKALLCSLDLPRHTMLAHNTAFDGSILAWRYGVKPKFYADTLSMSRPVTGATVGGSLAALTKKFLPGLEKGNEVVNARGKRLADFLPHELAAYGEYCKNDVVLCYLLYEIMKQWSTPQELYIIDMMLRWFIDPVFEVDKPLLQGHLSRVRNKKAELLSRISTLDPAGNSENTKDVLMSNPRLAGILENLGIEVPMKPSPANPAKMTYAFAKTDVAFKELLEHEDPRVQAIVAARLGVKSTLEETRTEAFIGIADRGTLPILVHYYGAHTGRGSGGDKINPQNMTRGSTLRHALLAPPGHLVVAGDSAQIEARILAWLAGEFELVSDFRLGKDVYCKFATDVYGRTITKVDVKERFTGKESILSLGFMVGWKKLQLTLKVKGGVILSDEEAQRIVSLYRNSMVMITNLWGQADEALTQMVRGYEYELGLHLKLRCTQEGVHLPNGMMLRYANLRRTRDGVVYDSRRGPVYLYSGKMVENIVQALARIVVFGQMAKMDQWLRPQDNGMPECQNGNANYANGVQRFKLVHSVHDEMVTVVPVDFAPQTKQKMTGIMSIPPRWAEGLPLSCEVHAGTSYGQCK